MNRDKRTIKFSLSLAVTTALLATLGACGQPNPSSPDFEAGQPPTEEFLIGKWDDPAGHCLATSMTLMPGGKTEGLGTAWRLNQGRLEIEDINSPPAIVAVVDADHIDVHFENDKTPHRLKRCPDGANTLNKKGN